MTVTQIVAQEYLPLVVKSYSSPLYPILRTSAR
jgi:hypothetical protein